MRSITRTGLERRALHAAHRARNAAVNVLLTGNPRGRVAKHPADFSEFVARQGGRQPSGFPDKWRINPRLAIDEPARVAVVLNAYYLDLLADLIARLETIPVPFDLFITNVSGRPIETPERVGKMRHCAILECENHGRDILPMVELVNSGALDPYHLILKVHTKKSPWREQHSDLAGSGDEWRGSFLDALLPSEDGVADILASFSEDASLGIVTAPGAIVDKEFWGGDLRLTRELMRRIELDVDPQALLFPSGSMYWCRGFILQGLRSLNLCAEDFDPEAGQIDGTTAHAIERMIGLLSTEAGYSMIETTSIETGAGSDRALVARFDLSEEISPRATVLPFYLPQFHPSPQNNTWWGEGFTEWHNVAGAIPAYEGHYQPKIPTELGFYDLRLDDVRRSQFDLAAAHGISGFMYYYYWFSGERLLNLPVEKLLASDVQSPFCLMWANENWSRRWDGRSEDILIGQDYDKVPAEDFIDDVMEFLKDPRYIRIDGKAVLAVYRPGQMSGFANIVRTWRERARAAGAGELLVLSVAVAKDFDAIGSEDRAAVDGTLDFPPHNLPWIPGPAVRAKLDKRWKGRFMSYRGTAEASIAKARALADDEFPGVMVNFDNTARRQWKPDVWYGSNPYTYRRWLASHVNGLMGRAPERRIVFINAWNEWAEGAILEPCTRFGRTFLLATRDVQYA